MARKTKVIGFSLPPETEQKLQDFAEKTHKTRSELMREMIDSYFESGKTTVVQATTQAENYPSLFKSIFEQQQLSSKQLLLICSIIIWHPSRKQILICRRAKTDELVTNLSWCFPGARMNSLDLFSTATEIANVRLGLDTSIGRVIAARRNPDIKKDMPITPISLYIEAKSMTIKPSLDHEIYRSYKWVEPMDIYSYFTTSVSSEVTEYLSNA